MVGVALGRGANCHCVAMNGRIHRRTGQHPFGGADPSFARMDSVGGGGSSRHFPGSIFSGGGVVAELFRDPYYVGWLNFFR